MKWLYGKLKSRLQSTFAFLIIFTLLFSFLGAVSPETVAAAEGTPSDSFTVDIKYGENGEPTTINTYTVAEMETLSVGETVYYSSIDTMPAPIITIARGVTLSNLVQDLNENHDANITLSSDTLQSIKFYATDGWNSTYSYDYFFGAPRYYYPQLVSCWDDDEPGSDADADPVEVEPMFAAYSFQERFLTDLDPSKMIGPGEEGSATFRFCIGQTADELVNVTPTTGGFLKYVNKMELVMAGSENLPAPELTADSTDNTVGQPIDITFTDDEAWREAITGITVNGDVLSDDQYTVSVGVTNIVAGVFTAAGDYEIVIQADGYENAIVSQIIISTSSPGVWDGTVDVSWYNDTDTEFYLSTPAQLAGLAALVNGHVDASVTPDMIIGDFEEAEDYWSGIDDFNGKTIYLTADMDMGGVLDGDTWSGPNWTPLGGQYCLELENPDTELSTSFNGTLDGQGHTLKNIYCNRHSSSYNLCRAVGGFVGRLGCHDSDDPSLFADNPTVRNLAVTGYIYGNRSTGGIVGKIGKTNNGGIIENCANFATVNNTDSKGCGGIVGAGWNEGYIKNCYNAGDVSSTYNCPTGGISGSNENDIYNCYNVGNIFARTDSFAMGIGTNNGIDQTVENCYWLEGSAPGGGYFNKPDADVEEVTGEYMKSTEFLAALNGDGNAFLQDIFNINNGYPILAWQAPEVPTHIVSITPVDDVEVPYGTAEAEAIVALASETTITDSDDATHTVALNWNIADYDGDTAGDYTATGAFDLPEGVEQSDPPMEFKVTATVTVLPDVAGIPLTVIVKEDGVETRTIEYDLSEWENVQQQHYSARDSMPAYRLAAAEGVFLTDFLDDAGIDVSKIAGFKFVSTDGYGMTLSKNVLLDTPRYYYPNIFSDNQEEGAVEVEPMLALKSYVGARGSEELPSWDMIDDLNTIRLFVGQTNPDEINYGMFAKWICEIEVELTVESETVEVVYPAEGDITEIEPETVIYADGKFTVPVSVTEFTFKDGGKEMKATFADNEWTITEVETRPVYTITPQEDEAYSIGKIDDGFNIMTVNSGFSGLKYFSVGVTPVIGHEGQETVVFVHLEDGTQRSINATRADFDTVPLAQAGFNVEPSDVVKVFIVDALTNADDHNPIVFQ